MTNIPRRNVFFLLFLLLALVAGLFAHDAARARRGTQGSAPPTQASTSAPGSAGAAGMVVAIDPETGALTAPTPEQLRELGAAEVAKPGRSNIETYQRPDGTVIGVLDESFQHYSVVQVGADGKLHSVCVHGEEKCTNALHSGQTNRASGQTGPDAAAPEQ